MRLFAAELARRFEGTARRSLAASPTEGAQPSLYCVEDPRARSGGLYDARGERALSALARDADLARALWVASEEWAALG